MLRTSHSRNAGIFLSTLSLRRATIKCRSAPCAVGDFYPRSPCGERPVSAAPLLGIFTFLSTLSLRRATLSQPQSLRSQTISIHALLAESDGRGVCKTIHPLIFLSTLSLRRATAETKSAVKAEQYFYPRSPCGERRASSNLTLDTARISIHALLAESDPVNAAGRAVVGVFLSTLSLRRAT